MTSKKKKNHVICGPVKPQNAKDKEGDKKTIKTPRKMAEEWLKTTAALPVATIEVWI